MVEDRKALREKQKLEKEIEEAKKLEKIKAEQNALQPKAPANLNLKVSSSRADPRGRMNPMDRADLDDAMPMAILNSGNTVTNNETIAPTLVKEINMTDSDPFIKSFANAKDFSFG
jgi:hypothetical protein